MGNICSKSSNKDTNFSTPGRPLGSSSNPTNTNTKAASGTQSRTPIPAKVTTTSSPGRTLGSSDGTNPPRSPDDARGAAARAAEDRANAANKGGGKLKSQLDAQKRKTQGQTLTGASEEERARRVADENEVRRNWN